MAELEAGAVLGNYRVDWLIGRGGMGAVYLAQHVRMENRKAALKVLSPELAGDPEFRDRFIRESDLAGSLEHPNIVPVYDAGEAEGVLYCVMRYVRGTDLGAVLDLEGRLTPARTYAVIAAVGRALDFAHAHGLLHRDVKPGNIMLESRRSLGGRERVFLTDFGLVKHLESNTKLTRTGHLVGTLDYTAPEVFRGDELDARADIYSLGCVLFECLTGALPFPGTSDAAVMYAHLQEPPPSVTASRPELPAAIDDVVARAMAKHRSDRFATCADLVRAARDALTPPQEPVVVPIGDAPSLRPWSPTRRFDPLIDVPRTLAVEPPPMRVVPVTTRQEPFDDDEPPAAPRRPARWWNGRRLIAVVVVLAMVGTATAAGIGALLSGGGAPPVADAVDAVVPVGPLPLAITFGDGSAWVVNSGGDGTVSRIDPATNEVIATIPVGADPQGAAFGDRSVWVVNSGGDSVSRIDPASNIVTDTILVGDTPEGAVFAEGALWVADAADNHVSRIASGINQVTDTIPVGAGPVSLAFDGRIVWVANVGDDTLTGIRAGDRRVVATVPVPGGVNSVTFDGRDLWVANAGSRHGIVSRVDSRLRQVVATFRVGPAPSAIAFAGGFVWVAQLFDGTLVKIDPTTDRFLGQITVGNGPSAIVEGAGALWVTRGDGTVARIRP